jgi:hypothetical protein
MARKTDKTHIPGTDSAKTYAEKQCTKKPATGSDLCKICQGMEEKHKAGTDKSKSWLGKLNESVPDHAHIVGSSWYKSKYPNGLPSVIPSTIPTTSANPAETETVAEDCGAEAFVAEWLVFTHKDGNSLVRNLQSGKVYKANLDKSGDEIVMVNDFMGRWENGSLNEYATEEDDE